MLGLWTLDTATAVEDADDEERIAHTGTQPAGVDIHGRRGLRRAQPGATRSFVLRPRNRGGVRTCFVPLLTETVMNIVRHSASSGACFSVSRKRVFAPSMSIGRLLRSEAVEAARSR
jgi:hypothetical protein